MIKFTEISIKEGYIYANVTDMESNMKAKVKLRVEQDTEDYKYYGDMSENTVKALWNLRDMYHKNGTLNETETLQ